VATYGVYRAIQNAPVRTVQMPTTPVVVAGRAMPVGTLLTRDELRVVSWPASNPVPGGFGDLEAVAGRGLVVTVAENEPITELKLAPREAGAGLPPTITPGMRAISIKVNEIIGVAGFVLPGAHVDVIVTVAGQVEGGAVARCVVSNLLVMAVGTRYDIEQNKEGKPIPTTVVTVAVTPEDAERIALAYSAGGIVLALRNPLDKAPTQTPGIRLAALVGPPAPPPVVKTVQGRKVVVAAPPPPPAPKPYTVETIRAAKRTEEVIK
jgi:pilus assembly protein CpaB